MKNMRGYSPHETTYKQKVAEYRRQYGQLKETDLAWLAGIIDGEGCISIWRGKYPDTSTHPHWSPFRYRPELRVYNTNSQIIMRVLQILNNGSANGAIKTYATCSSQIPNAKPEHHVAVMGYRLIALLEYVLPFLVGKKRQAKIILEWYDKRSKCGLLGLTQEGGRRGYTKEELGLVEEMYKLNKRGVV